MADEARKQMTATERYECDPSFNRLVDLMYSVIAEGKFTPTEIRQAAILAATRFEYYNARPLIYGPDALHDIMRHSNVASTRATYSPIDMEHTGTREGK